MESAVHGCIATTDATGEQAKGDSGALALSTCFYTSNVRSIRQGPYAVFTAPLLHEHGI